MYTALYSVLKQALDSKQQINDYDLQQKTHTVSSINYILIQLATINKLFVCSIDDHDYQVVEHHLSFYETQSEKEGFLSAYHYTGTFQLAKKDHAPVKKIKVRVYFDRFDACCVEPIVWFWSNELPKQQAATPSPEFLSTNEKNRFRQAVIELIAPIITTLRQKQIEQMTQLVSEYDNTEQDLINISKELFNSSIIKPKRLKKLKENYRKRIPKIIVILQQLCRVADQADNYQAILSFYNRLNDNFVVATGQVNTDKKPLEQQEAVADQLMLTTTPEQAIKSSSASHEQLPEVIKPYLAQSYLDDLATQINKANGLDNVKAVYDQLQQVFEHKQFATKDSISLWYAMTCVEEAISRYALEKISTSNISLTEFEPLYQYVLAIPTDTIERLVAQDRADILKILLNSGKLSLYQPMPITAEKTVPLCCYIYLQEQPKTILMMYERGIAVVELLDHAFKLFDQQHQLIADNLLPMLEKMIKVSRAMLPHSTYALSLAMTDSNHNYLNQLLVKHKHNQYLNLAFALSQLLKFLLDAIGMSPPLGASSMLPKPGTYSWLFDYLVDITKQQQENQISVCEEVEKMNSDIQEFKHFFDSWSNTVIDFNNKLQSLSTENYKNLMSAVYNTIATGVSLYLNYKDLKKVVDSQKKIQDGLNELKTMQQALEPSAPHTIMLRIYYQSQLDEIQQSLKNFQQNIDAMQSNIENKYKRELSTATESLIDVLFGYNMITEEHAQVLWLIITSSLHNNNWTNLVEQYASATQTNAGDTGITTVGHFASSTAIPTATTTTQVSSMSLNQSQPAISHNPG